ncbi:uncharacterized protein Z519_06269 [Cladophialophora bantiana CBS 173.52]|uniref:Alcohol dehydrogenase-like C-terminal domain-containing protein n=1 Tax=Cladophialophora bantiana (strain ATCC 10958 / CBS 173.52 / CDC B-1940 / NIH 8579) TaxID=1442370 RepID=A0A0D2IA50_CLAB1|nr:uncharacterized protein Z519_06269 [Cladophialophora bantiana CBS 173.52]KIW93664.1 hypothetical protein Z519_06269 [Cladophialophora bantiana CBS 173.52]
MASDLPSHHRVLVLEAVGAGFKTKTVPMPCLDAGSAIVQVLSAGVLSYHREIYNGQRHYSFPNRSSAASARSHASQRWDLMRLFVTAIHEGMNDRSKKLITNVWRDGVFAQDAKPPLENCIPLDETKLCRQLGYATNDLMYLYLLLVAYGGFRDIRLEPGETVVVSPATGRFGGAGVQVAVAMGARVIAMRRNEKELARLSAHIKRGIPRACIEIVKLTGNLETDTVALQAFGTIDASAVRALRRGGRCSIMGYVEDVMDYKVMALNIASKGKLMYEREDVVLFVKMLESGLFPRGKDFADVKAFAMEDWKEALDRAAEHIGIGKVVVIEPWF